MKIRSSTRRTCVALMVQTTLACSAMSTAALAQDTSTHGEDSGTCASFGAPPGSRDYSRCMLSQQQRRDYAPLNAAEAQRLSAEAARNNVETVRRMRCEREAKKAYEQGAPHRRC